jgi:uncharacterized protein YjbI with pentapeptide repeats
MSGPNIHKPPEFCSVEMSDGKPCGRAVHLHRAPNDPGYVCLMHSHDPDKGYGLSEAFERELNAIMDGSSIHNRVKNKWDFQAFVFFRAKFANWSVSARFAKVEVNFAQCTFKWHALFSSSSFDCDIDFTDASFERGSNFEQTRFEQQVRFWRAQFREKTNFNWASFAKEADYSLAKFHGEAGFARTTFSGNAIFRYVSFAGQTCFSNSNFMQDADFMAAGFENSADFSKANFSSIADFRGSEFRVPTEVVFHRVNNADRLDSPGLRVRLVGSLPEDIRFEDVNWSRKNGRIYLEDEADLSDHKGGQDGTPAGNAGQPAILTHELVADVYRRLVNNFEKSRQYVWAEECFLGEMEMRRRNPRHFLFARFEWARDLYAHYSWTRGIGETISFTSFYRWLSNYGSSYVRALCVLAALLVLFAFLLPAFGLRMPADSKTQAMCPTTIPGTPEATVISWHCAMAHPHWVGELAHTFNAGFWDAFEVAVFQKNRTIEPATTSARRVEIFESIVIPGQFALLLLAIRRRFRR